MFDFEYFTVTITAAIIYFYFWLSSRSVSTRYDLELVVFLTDLCNSLILKFKI